MPSIRYMNQSAPFWDFVANLEAEGSNHPFFAGQNREGHGSSDEEGWGWGWGWPNRGWHRGPNGGGLPHHFGPPHPPHHPPPPGPEGPPHPPPPPEHEGPPRAPGEEPDEPEQPPRDCPGGDRRRHGHHGPGRWGGRGGRRGWGRGGRWGGPAGAYNMGALGEFIQSQMFGQNEDGEHAEDFKPDVDVFETETAFVLHASLPGAKKEDIAVNWDADKSELSISGVIYRPGDEEFLKTLAMDERKVGAFERKVRLGTRANPAHVDSEDLKAKLEDGVLLIEVPKMAEKEYVEVKKIDID